MIAAEGRAPGKVILLGEHAVVYGGWALAAPWPAVEAVATAEPAEGETQVLSDQDFETPGLTAAARAIQPDGLIVRLRSTVPAGAGLGSSAATALAVVRAVAAAGGKAIDELAMADIAELHAHGRSSGLDAATAASAGPVLFRRGDGALPLSVALPPLVVAHTGLPRNTQEAVAIIAQARDTKQGVVDTLGRLALEGVTALETGDLPALGKLMDEAHAGLTDLGVSHPDLDRLVAVARANGALGAKLTGAGRGGCVVALAADADAAKRVANALIDAGAPRVWTQDGPA